MKLTVILGDGANLVSSGWHTIEPQECWVNRIPSRTGYYFATSGPGENWGGRSDFCASLKSRVGDVPQDCPDGFRKLPFKRVSLDKTDVFSDLK